MRQRPSNRKPDEPFRARVVAEPALQRTGNHTHQTMTVLSHAVFSHMVAPRILALLLLAACGAPPPPDRAQELAACRRVSTSGDALGRCLFIKYHWAPADAGPVKAAWQRHLDSLSAGPVIAEPSEEQADAEVRRWVGCIYQETGGHWDANLSVAHYNCRDHLPDVDALLRFTRRIPSDSSRLLLEAFNATELSP